MGGEQIHPEPDGRGRGPKNPFAYDSHVTWYEGIKITLMCLTCIPLLRALLLLLLIPVLMFWAWLAHLGHSQKGDLPQPLAPWRAIFLIPLACTIRIWLFVLGFYWIEVEGDPWHGEAKTAPVMVSNHVSMWDIFVLWYLRRPAAVGKSSLWQNPVLRPLAVASQAIPVDRSSAESRERAKRLIHCQTNDPRFPPLLVFPQGTCTHQTYVSMFKNGAFQDGLPVIPIAIRYPNSHFDLAYTFPSSKDLVPLRMLSQVYIRCKVSFLPVYRPSESEKADPNLFAKNVRDAIAEKLSARRTMHEYKDMMLYTAAHNLVHDVDLGDFTIFNEAGESQIELEQAKRILLKFRSVDANKDGVITLEEFGDALGLEQDSELAKRMFEFFDRNGDGLINFAELAAGALLCVHHEQEEPETVGEEGPEAIGDEGKAMERKGATWQQLCRFAFDVLDRDGDGEVSMTDLNDLVERTNVGADGPASSGIENDPPTEPLEDAQNSDPNHADAQNLKRGASGKVAWGHGTSLGYPHALEDGDNDDSVPRDRRYAPHGSATVSSEGSGVRPRMCETALRDQSAMEGSITLAEFEGMVECERLRLLEAAGATQSTEGASSFKFFAFHRIPAIRDPARSCRSSE